MGKTVEEAHLMVGRPPGWEGLEKVSAESTRRETERQIGGKLQVGGMEEGGMWEGHLKET